VKCDWILNLFQITKKIKSEFQTELCISATVPERGRKKLNLITSLYKAGFVFAISSSSSFTGVTTHCGF
jgi:hypothetical protein